MPYPGARKRIRVTAKVLNEGTGAYDLTDPTSLTVVVEAPDGTTTTYTWPAPGTITKASTGQFYVDHTCSQSGEWNVSTTAAGAVVGVDQASWIISPALV